MTRQPTAKRLGLCLALAVCVGALAVAGCGGGNSSGSGSSTAVATAAKDIRIAFFTDSLDNAYLQAGVAAGKAEAAKRGVKLDVISAGWDPNKQLTQIQDAVASQRYDAMVVESIDCQVTCKALTKAAKQMVVSIYNAPICGNYTNLFTDGTIGFFGRNEYDGGVMMADQVAKAIGGKGKVGYISGPVQAGIVKNGTSAGIKAKLKEFPNVKLVAELDGAWDPAKGLAATQDLLQAHPDIDGIIYGVDQMAVPSITWLKKNNKLGGRKIVTLGGTTQGLKLIEDGSIFSPVNSLPREEAAYAVQAAIDKLQNKPTQFPGWDANTKVYDVLKDPQQPPILQKSNVGGMTAEWGV
jgi:ribose transport system substrate-binding protein